MALENKLGITDSAELAREEERISKKRRSVCLKAANWTPFLSEHLRRCKRFIKHCLKTSMTLPENCVLSILQKVISVLHH